MYLECKEWQHKTTTNAGYVLRQILHWISGEDDEDLLSQPVSSTIWLVDSDRKRIGTIYLKEDHTVEIKGIVVKGAPTLPPVLRGQ